MSSLTIQLASQSPRRKMLLEACGLQIQVLPQYGDETWPKAESPEDVMLGIARAKLAGARDVNADLPLVVADTAVWLNGTPLGKPHSEAHALKMLQDLSGSCHEVLSSVGLAFRGRTSLLTVETRIWFRALSDAALTRYVASGEPMDKAGAYGIQGAAGAFVDRIEGSYTNVVGLPIAETLAGLESLGWNR